jgi:predicted dehydrogenase
MSAPLKVGLIGLGGVARRIHLPAIAALPDVQLVGAVEISPDAARLAQRQFPIPRVYESVGDLLAQSRPDMVIVGTPPALHFEQAKAALEAGAHVLCEKPFTATLSEADRLIAGARRAGRLLAVNNQYRYMTLYRQTRERLRAGEFGPPYQIQVWQQMYHPPSFEKNWRASLVRSTLYEFGTHALDLVCFLFDALPTAVTARTPRVPHGVDSDVLVVALLDFPGDRVATLNFHRVSQAPERYLEMRLDARDASIRLSLGGVARLSLDWVKSLGRPALRASFARGGEVRVERNGRSRVLVRSPRPEFASATAAHLAAFVGKIRAGDVEPTAAVHAREVLKTVFAAYRSSETGATVRLDEFGAKSRANTVAPRPS